MDIALFHTTLPQPNRKLGGVEVTVHRLANALILYENFRVTVFSCDAKPHDASYEHVQLFPRWPAAGSRLGRLSVLPVFLNFVQFRHFDVLHLHGDDWFFINRRVPTIRTFHGSALQEARFAGRMKRRLLQYAVYPLEHLSAALATYTLAIGPETKQIYRTNGIADNGVDTSIFAPRPKAADPLLFYVGSWRGRKRGELAFETFRREVLPAFPRALLYMASDYAPSHPAVIAGGFPDQNTLAEWLGKAWVFLYPSTYEGFGIPYIEALASGTAIVTTPNSGAEYVLDGGRLGVICQDTELGSSVITLLRDTDKRAALEQHGREHVHRFSWSAVAACHAEIYRVVRSGGTASFAHPPRSER